MICCKLDVKHALGQPDANVVLRDKKRTKVDEDSNQRMVRKHFGTKWDI
jgi:hypothetical protein